MTIAWPFDKTSTGSNDGLGYNLVRVIMARFPAWSQSVGAPNITEILDWVQSNAIVLNLDWSKFTAGYNIENKKNYRILFDKTFSPTYPTYHRSKRFKKKLRFNIIYDRMSTSAGVSDVESNPIFVFFMSYQTLTNDVPATVPNKIHWMARLNYQDA